MQKILYFWRYYTLGYDQYYQCMKKTYKKNLYSLLQANVLVVILSCAFACVPLFLQNDPKRSIFYFTAAFVGLLLFFIANWSIRAVDKQKKEPNKYYVNTLTVIYYLNIIALGMFLGVWSDPGNYAVTFMIFLVCAMFLFFTSPVFHLCITLLATVFFIFSVIIFKSAEVQVIDICNAIFSCFISLFVCWRITMLRLVSDLNAYKLEDERNRYFDQSTIDELTQLRNRRDFMHTFNRYLVNYRSSDDFLCVAIADIDFFKNYNDFYGHPKGDDCLRSIGGAFNRLKDTLGVYCARVGGEEFALLWFEKDKAHVDTVIKRVSKIIKTLKIKHEKSNISEYITLSIGVYVEKCGASNNADDLYNLADKALYSAKGNGRNCAIIRGRDISQYQIKP